jgi:hypothetical protein
LLEKAEEGDLEEVTTYELIRLMETGVKMERQATGLPDWAIDILGMENDDLQRAFRDTLRLLAEAGFDPGVDGAAWSLSEPEAEDEDGIINSRATSGTANGIP